MSKPQPFIVKPQDHAPLQVVGETISVLAGVEKTGSVEVFLQSGPEGAGPPPHTHAWDETYYVLDGQIDVLLGDRVHTVSQGELVFIPGGTPHNFQMKSKTAKFLSLNSRGGASRFFESVDREVGGAMNIPKIVEIAGRHEVFLAPPPGAK
jgi:quercetin dioxygenase-like cupin family protein